MKFSIWPGTKQSTTEILDVARSADQQGWHGIWIADHYMPNTGSEKLSPGDTNECWSLLGAIASATSRSRFGPLVSPTSVHHPALLANRAATLDQISNGRFVLGLGAGWQINEHKAYGIDLEEPGPRVSRFEESIEIVVSLLSQPTTSFDGQFYQMTDAPCDPKPVQSPLPIVVGTGSPRMLRITAKYASEWNTWGTPANAAEGISNFRSACEAVEADFGQKWKSVQAMVNLADGASGEGLPGAPTISGSVDEIVAEIGKYDDLGFDEFIVFHDALGETVAERAGTMDRFWNEVASQFR